MKLKTLSIATGVLFVLSILVYYNENRRGTELLSGSDYVKGLDIEKVQKITLDLKEEESVVLVRNNGRFVIENHKSYPASAEKVNDLIYKIANIQVREKVASGAGEEDLANYGLDGPSDPYSVELFDGEGKKTVSFKVGESRRGRGNYLLGEENGDVYLSEESLRIASSYKDFIDTALMEVPEAEIEGMSLSFGSQIELSRNDEGKLSVASPRSSRSDDAKAEEYARGLRHLRFDDFFALSDPKAQGLNFDRSIKVRLKNRLVYQVFLTRRGEEYFAKVEASLDEPSEPAAPADGQESPQVDVGEVVKAQSQAQIFNGVRRHWIYGIGKETYEKIVKSASFFTKG